MNNLESSQDDLLREGLRVNPLSTDAMARIRAATEAEWRAQVEQPRRRWPLAVAASLLAVLASGGYLMTSPSAGGESGDLVAHLIRFESPGFVELHMLGSATPLAEGSVLRAGQEYRAVGQALLELEGGGNLRVAGGSEFEFLGNSDVRLESGEIYVDIPPGSHSTSAFVARTAAGEFRHVGTQFALAVKDSRTRLRVREGSVRWLTAGDDATVDAGLEVLFVKDAKSAERPVDPSGSAWDWTAKTTPDFEIDEKPLEDFLLWVARESGRKLVLADDQARARIASIRMHGSVRGLTPLQALSAVMAATELHYELADGQLRVKFAGETALRK